VLPEMGACCSIWGRSLVEITFLWDRWQRTCLKMGGKEHVEPGSKRHKIPVFSPEKRILHIDKVNTSIQEGISEQVFEDVSTPEHMAYVSGKANFLNHFYEEAMEEFKMCETFLSEIKPPISADNFRNLSYYMGQVKYRLGREQAILRARNTRSAKNSGAKPDETLDTQLDAKSYKPIAEQMLATLKDPGVQQQISQQSSFVEYDKMNVQEPQQLQYVDASENRRGIVVFMAVDEDVISARKLNHLDGLREEVAAFVASGAQGAYELEECLRYVLDEEAGSSPKIFVNSPYPRDCDENGLLEDRKVWRDGRQFPKRLKDFLEEEPVRISGIKIEHVAALRFYTTAAYKYINEPLRDMERYAKGIPHPLPLTVMLITEATKMLGAAEAKLLSDTMQPKSLFRGMRNVMLPADFLRDGGVEIAPMSTTTDIAVAMKYSLSAASVLLRIETSNFMKRGVSVRWLSAFPAEEEILYPPLTFLHAEGEYEHVEHTASGMCWTVVTVKPILA